MPAFGNFLLDKGYDADAAIVKFTAVKWGSSDESVTPCTVAGESGVGICQVGVSAAEITKGKGAPVRRQGITEWECGGTITRGNQVTVDADGKCVAAAGQDFLWGVAEQDGVDGERIAVSLADVKNRVETTT
jgi:hypothetical protein